MQKEKITISTIKGARDSILHTEAEKALDAINEFIMIVSNLRNDWIAKIYYEWMEDNLMRTLYMFLDNEDIGKQAEQTIQVVEKFFEFWKGKKDE